MRYPILGALAACVILPSGAAAQAGRPITYDDFYRIEAVGQVALSPDGRQVVFVRGSTVEAENRSHGELWLVATDGSGTPTRLTSPSTEVSSPRWSPDGRLLAFSRRPGPGEEGEDVGGVWFLPMDEPGEAFRIAGVRGAPLFDPTGRWIAFTRAVAPSGEAPQAPAPATEAERKIVERFDGKDFDWMGYRFDRAGYLRDPRDPWATPPSQLFVVPRDGDGTARQITQLGVDVRAPAWSADGTRVAFVADTHQRDEHTYERADLWTVTVDGQVTRLTDDELDYGAPAWSPDGSRIVVVGKTGLDVVIRERWGHGAPTDLYLISADGRERRNVTEAFDLIPSSPGFSPDGRWIYFTAQKGGTRHLFRLDVRGGTPEMVTTGDRRISSPSFSADGSLVAYDAVTPTDPGNVYVARTDDAGRTERKLTDLNADLLAQLQLSTPRRTTFRSADGTEVEGWVMPPVGWDEGGEGSWPLILDIHGGPHGAYGYEFSFERQLQAASGYFVLFTNPRGSTGYGEDFLWAIWGSWGDEDFDDIMAGVDHVVANYPVDPERMGVTGYSYGGYMTNWVITHTHRFAAAVTGAGISNWMSDYGTADIPRTKESEFFGAPWEQEGLKNLLASSPIVHAKGVTTPTLFVHGESDHRVPIEEAEQMYTALQKQGVPARMIRYPDSYHGGWTPWRLLHRYWSSVQWFDHWLKRQPMS